MRSYLFIFIQHIQHLISKLKAVLYFGYPLNLDVYILKFSAFLSFIEKT